jgi:hypothetical protein
MVAQTDRLHVRLGKPPLLMRLTGVRLPPQQDVTAEAFPNLNLKVGETR